jgi:hypothetical protein
VRRLAERALEDAARRALLGFVLPAWIGAGLADWLCHRRSDIEHTAGPTEAAIHALMMSEAGVPTLLGLFLEANAGLLATCYAALGLHQATAAWDVRYAESRREVTPTEQHVHGMLEQVPVMAVVLLTVLHTGQARALIGRGGERPRLGPERKRRPLPRSQRAAVLGAVALFGALPYGEEVVRCVRAAQRRGGNGSTTGTARPEDGYRAAVKTSEPNTLGTAAA